MAETMVERMALAYEDEKDRWILRDATWLPESRSYEVCRFDDSGVAGSFDEIHRHKRADDAEADLQKMLTTRPAIAALKAMRGPTESMRLAASLVGSDDFTYAENDLLVWQAMIDKAIKEGGGAG